ncbi:class I SAM-dependent methyltransferase [Pseudonocardia phyllosphaerae]|uniref:class I SAM-dependent methyltransferase n=1 Tax=Pseudonocardia phyllosphaerae TaxID=3390502 RepID=UPI0039795B1E
MIRGPYSLFLGARRRAGRMFENVVDQALDRQTVGQAATLRTELAALREQLRAEVRDDVREELRAELHGDLRAEYEARLRAEIDRVVDEIRGVEVRERRDLVAAGEREAVASSARFAREHLIDAAMLPHPHDTLRHALGQAPSGGMALEFGVYVGTTLTIIAEHRTTGGVYGFDTFTGLPETWRQGFRAGAFDDLEALPEVPGAELVVGLFDDTLPGFLAEHPGPVDFLHVDSDLYSSAVTVLDAVGPRLRAGSVVLFDEFFNFPDWEQHEARAWWEYADKHGVRWSYVCCTADHEQVAVRIDEPGC